MKKQLNEIRRMQQLAGINLNENFEDNSPTDSIVRYEIHTGEGSFYQTEKGISILKSILDDWNKNNPVLSNAYTSLLSAEKGSDFFKNHPLYKQYVGEGNTLFSKLKQYAPEIENNVYGENGEYIGPFLYTEMDDESERVIFDNFSVIDASANSEYGKILMSIIGD